MESKYKGYRAIINDSRSFNNRLAIDRKQRLPYFDSHTGIVQSDCSLWHTKEDRLEMTTLGSNYQTATLYSYPAQRWQKRRRQFLLRSDDSATIAPAPLASVCTRDSSPLPSQTLASHLNQISNLNISCTHASQNQNRKNNLSTTLTINCTSGSSQIISCSRPPRSESACSYSFADSDSRDQSSATSQSLDSPRSQQHLDDEHLNNHQQAFTGEDDNILVRNHPVAKVSNVVANTMSTVKIEKKADEDERPINDNDDCGSNLQVKNSSDRPLAIIANGGRPFVCSICDQSYKTRPGLSYHFVHKHNTVLPRNCPTKTRTDLTSIKAHEHPTINNNKRNSTSHGAKLLRSRRRAKIASDSSADDHTKNEDSTPAPIGTPPTTSEDNSEENDENETSLNSDSDGTVIETRSPSPTVLGTLKEYKPAIKNNPAVDTDYVRYENGIDNSLNSNGTSIGNKTASARQNIFCDFCLGTIERNRRTRLPEELISCSNCGSSGHPSCLRFSDNIKSSVKKYNWQCIECKTCSTCNAADNEDQLLFCDDCDRSYHTYCLDPPLDKLPEGHWSCNLCITEYYEKNE